MYIGKSAKTYADPAGCVFSQDQKDLKISPWADPKD